MEHKRYDRNGPSKGIKGHVFLAGPVVGEGRGLELAACEA